LFAEHVEAGNRERSAVERLRFDSDLSSPTVFEHRAAGLRLDLSRLPLRELAAYIGGSDAARFAHSPRPTPDKRRTSSIALSQTPHP
jgi:hypothetical protein